MDKSKVDQPNIIDKASGSSYELLFTSLPNNIGEGLEHFALNIHTTSIPSIDMAKIEWRWQGGYTFRPDGIIQFGEWQFEFLVDEYLNNWCFFYRWLTYLHNNYDKFTEDWPNYTAQAAIIIRNNWKINTLEIRMHNVWPTSLGNLPLTSRQNEDYIECSASISYDRYEVFRDGTKIEVLPQTK